MWNATEQATYAMGLRVMQRFHNEDDEYLGWVEENAGAWIATVYGDHLQLHRGGCGQFSGVHGQFTTYPK